MRFPVIRFFVLFITLGAIFAGTSVSQAEPSRYLRHRMGSPGKGERNFIGVKNQNCSNCHANSGPKSELTLPADLRSAINDGWILGDELLTWSQQDHHYNAFSILQNELSQQMARNLGIVDADSGKSLVHQDRRCLACHSSVPFDQMEQKGIHGELISTSTVEDPRYTIGVSCEACHGPAGRDKAGRIGWGSAHALPGDDANRWRLLSADEKFNEYGYWDIRSTETQTRICMSCHLGNVEQKKIITHEMYAAGHPPLPSFELSQFVRQMPPHWRRFEEKPQEVRVAYLSEVRQRTNVRENELLDSGTQNLAMTRATMISSFIVLEEAMRLTADLLEQSPPVVRHPELANYACFACHHELVRDGWRKSRRLTSPPGRPVLHEWPLQLARVTERTMGQDTLTSKTDDLVTALTSHPFGKKDELVRAATALADTSLKCAETLKIQAIDKVKANQFLKSLAAFGAEKDVDYDSARQLVWAYERSLAEIQELKIHRGSAEDKEGEDQFGQDPILAEFEQTLILQLRKNRKKAAPANPGAQTEPLTRAEKEINVSVALSQIAKYDPAVIRKIFERLLRDLEQDKLAAE